jgi:hypothetical protein
MPGGSVGAGGAITWGVNRLPAVGLRLFSVGAGGAALVAGGVAVVVVDVVVVNGVGLWLLVHPATSAMRTAPPTTAIDR